MNRQHTRDDYLRLVERIRTARNDIALSSDFITGFPGESDKDFADTLALVREVNFAAAFSFQYSPRPGTPAASMAKQIPDAVKHERLLALQALLAEQQRAFNAGCDGRAMSILFEKPGRKPGQIVGRSPYLQPVHVDGPESLIGQIHDARIVVTPSNSLTGALADARESMAAR
jgi:tRNA-2-methylthio-N6-dimethylallyladenosine synthase